MTVFYKRIQHKQNTCAVIVFNHYSDLPTATWSVPQKNPSDALTANIQPLILLCPQLGSLTAQSPKNTLKAWLQAEFFVNFFVLWGSILSYYVL